MNYIKKIAELSDLCLRADDVVRVHKWLDSRALVPVKEIIVSEFHKFKNKKPKSDEEKIEYDEKYANFADLESTIIEYLRLNNYEEDELEDYYDEEY